VPAGSLFAFLQSAGAGGKAAETLHAMCQVHQQFAGVFAAAASGAGSGVFACDVYGVCAKI
jgi:hypothetical protein